MDCPGNIVGTSYRDVTCSNLDSASNVNFWGKILVSHLVQNDRALNKTIKNTFLRQSGKVKHEMVIRYY